MPDKVMKLPGADHPITISPSGARIVIKIAGKTLVDTRDAMTLKEATYPGVHYIPRKDVDMSLLERSDHTTYCPYKGECSYFSIPLGGSRSRNAVWTYETPYPAAAGIASYLAFYPDRVDSMEVTPAA